MLHTLTWAAVSETPRTLPQLQMKSAHHICIHLPEFWHIKEMVADQRLKRARNVPGYKTEVIPMRMTLITLPVLALTIGMAGDAMARDYMQSSSRQSHEESFGFSSEAHAQTPRTRTRIDEMFTNSINRTNSGCASQNSNNTQSSNGSHSTQGEGCM